jgi:hypothetical protein
MNEALVELLPDSFGTDKAAPDIGHLLQMDNTNTGCSLVGDIHILGGDADVVHNLCRADGIVRCSWQQNYFLDREEDNNSDNCIDSDSGSVNVLGVDTDMYDFDFDHPCPPDVVEVENRDVALQENSLQDAAYELLAPPVPSARPIVSSRMRTAARLGAQMMDFWYEICHSCLRSLLIPELMPLSPIPVIL